MGWAVGYDDNWQRDIGYGVPCECDHPGCKRKIDRGLAHVCGGEPYGGESGCGLYFCGHHLAHYRSADGLLGPAMCERCAAGKRPFKPKPDVRRWLRHKLTDKTWRAWRDENAASVARIKRRLAKR